MAEVGPIQTYPRVYRMSVEQSATFTFRAVTATYMAGAVSAVEVMRIQISARAKRLRRWHHQGVRVGRQRLPRFLWFAG
jgi:hypothetical protein